MSPALVTVTTNRRATKEALKFSGAKLRAHDCAFSASFRSRECACSGANFELMIVLCLVLNVVLVIVLLLLLNFVLMIVLFLVLKVAVDLIYWAPYPGAHFCLCDI